MIDINGTLYSLSDVARLIAERDMALLQIDKLKRTICAGICGVDFPGFQYGEHMPRCPLRTPCQRAHTLTSMPALYQDGVRGIQCGNCDTLIPNVPPITENRNHP